MNWTEIFDNVRAVRRSSRLNEGWELDLDRLFLAPYLYNEAILIQYLVSRSHTHGGLTLEGRLTLMDLIRRLRYSGYLERIGITETDPGDVFERVVDHLAATHDWTRVSTGSDSDRIKKATKSKKKAAKKSAKKSSKSRKTKTSLPDQDELVAEPVKLYYLVDRRDFLEKVKRVYAAYA